MSWSIFGRLFWKVWREDWKRWAGMAMTLLIARVALSLDRQVSFIIVMFAWIVILLLLVIEAMNRAHNDRSFMLKDPPGTLTGPHVICLSSMLVLGIGTILIGLLCSWCIPIRDFIPEVNIIRLVCLYTPLTIICCYELAIWSDANDISLAAAMSVTIFWCCFATAFFLSIYFSEQHHTTKTWMDVLAVVITLTPILSLRYLRPSFQRYQRTMCFIIVIIIVCAATALQTYMILRKQPPNTVIELQTCRWDMIDNTKHGQWIMINRQLGKMFDISKTKISLPLELEDSGTLWGLRIDDQSTSLVKWIIGQPIMASIAVIDSALVQRTASTPNSITLSTDKQYLVFRTHAIYGNGYDYISLNTATKRTQLLMPNEASFSVQMLSGALCAFVDVRNDDFRIFDLNSGKPVNDYSVAKAEGKNEQ